MRARKAYYAPNEKDARAAAGIPGPAVAAPAPAAATARSEAATRYLALVAGHRATPRAEDLDALARISPRELKKTVAAVNLDAGCAFDCRRAAVLLHTDAARRLLGAGDVGAADEHRTFAVELLRGLRGAPEAADFERLLYHTLGDSELELGRVPDASALFDALVKAYPQDAEAQLARGRADEAGLYILSLVARTSRVDQPELSAAGFDFNRYQRSRAGSPIVGGEETYRRSAIERYREALRLEPKLVEAQLRLGRVLWLDGKADEAARELSSVASGSAPEARQLAHLLLSRIEDERGRPAEALAHAEAAVAARPLWQSGRLALADLLLRSGKPEEARLDRGPGCRRPRRPDERGWLAALQPRGRGARRGHASSAEGDGAPVSRRMLVLALALAASSARAQQPPQFPSEVSVVEVDVAVTRDNRPASGLGAADFEVKDSGVLQTVELVERSRARVHAILLLDTSESVAGDKLQQLTRAARAFVEGLSAEDAVTLLSFSYRVRLLGEPASAPAAAASALSQLAAGGTTALIDATAAATALADPRRGRPVVLVFSDGDDRLSWMTERHALDAARHTDVVIHAVGFSPPRAGARDRMGPLPNQQLHLEGAPGFLERLTRATGGQLWFADSPRDLSAAFQSVLEEVRERYLLRYEPTGVLAGGWHPLEVHVRGKGLVVRCRPGYQAAGAEP